MKRTGPSNMHVLNLIKELKKLSIEQKVNIWKRIAEDLEMPRRRKRIVNLYKIDKYSQPDETVIVPGKVLGVGEITKPITIAALSFSESARQKITAQKAQALSIPELLKKNPKGNNVRILG